MRTPATIASTGARPSRLNSGALPFSPGAHMYAAVNTAPAATKAAHNGIRRIDPDGRPPMRGL